MAFEISNNFNARYNNIDYAVENGVLYDSARNQVGNVSVLETGELGIQIGENFFSESALSALQGLVQWQSDQAVTNHTVPTHAAFVQVQGYQFALAAPEGDGERRVSDTLGQTVGFLANDYFYPVPAPAGNPRVDIPADAVWFDAQCQIIQTNAARGTTITVPPGGDIASAMAAAQPGDTIQLQPGTYRVTNTVLMRPGVNLQGAGDATVIENAAPWDAILVPPGVTGSSISDLRIVGAGGRGSGIFVHGDETTISNVTSQGNQGHGISLHEAQRCVVENSTVSGNGGIGISMFDADFNTIRGCTALDNGAEGITIDHDSDNNLVDGNYLNRNCRVGGVGGIGMDWCDGNQVSNNTILNTLNAAAGIAFQNNEGPSDNNSLLDNTIEHDGGPGIWLRHQLYPDQSAQWNSTGNHGPSSTNNTTVRGNRITVRNFDDVIIVDGSATTTTGTDIVDAWVVYGDGRIGTIGDPNSQGNHGNIQEDNRSP